MSSAPASSGAPSTAAAAGAAPPGSTQQKDMNDQTSGDLYAFIQRLHPLVPLGAGEMPVEEVLEALQAAAPEVFAGVDQLLKAAEQIMHLDESMAVRWKDKGNQEFSGMGKPEQALLSYTHGLQCAEKPETVAALLNNRSTVFFHLKQYVNACVDADQALLVQPDYWKALQRRGRSLEELGFEVVGRKDVQAAVMEDATFGNDRATMEKILRDVLLGGVQVVLPPRVQLQAPVHVERLGVKGRGLVATSRLDAGPVLCETPFAATARAETMLSVCSYCLRYTTCLYAGKPYRAHNFKSRGFFCSDACAEASWRHYGEAETKNAFFLCCPNDALLATRMVRGLTLFPSSKVAPEAVPHGLQDTDGTAHASETSTAAPHHGPAMDLSIEPTFPLPEGFEPVSHNEFGASHIATLEANVSKEINEHAVCGGYETVVCCLGMYMKAFASAAEAERTRKAMRQVLLNASDVTCLLRVAAASGADTGAHGGAIHSNMTAVLGKAVYPVAALLNHSCDPNCFVSVEGNPQASSTKLVVRAIRPVMEGEELTIAYGGIDRFRFHSMRNRLQTLRSRYGFFCRCTACQSQVDEVVREAEKAEYIKAADYYQKGRRMIREGDYQTAVTVLLQSYEIVMRYICPPPRPPQSMLPKTHEALALAYFHLNNRAKCVEHLKAALEVDLQIHGTDNRVEMINEYTRLSFVCPAMEDRQLYADKAIALLERFYAPCDMLNLQLRYVASSYVVEPQVAAEAAETEEDKTTQKEATEASDATTA